MKKFTLKLDAICAKLKEGLSGPLENGGAPFSGVSTQEDAIQLVDSKFGMCRNELHHNVSKYAKDEMNGFVEIDSPTVKDVGLNGHADMPKILCGASKRKSRLKLVPRRVVDPLDSEQPELNGYANSIGLNGHVEFPEDKEANDEITQGSNASDSSSMQTSCRDSDSADSHGNHSKMEGAVSDQSSQSDDGAPVWYEDNSSDCPETSGQDLEEAVPVGDDDEPRSDTPADFSNLKAIQEYAERSMTTDQSGLPIEEGLATNDVICELREEKENEATSQNQTNGDDGSQENGHISEEDYSVKDDDYCLPTEMRVSPLNIPVIKKEKPPKNPYNPSDVQEYASHTMKELIGMYGFDEDDQDMARDVPLDSFSFKNILKMDRTMTSKRKNDALQKYMKRRANLQIPNPARICAASNHQADDTGSHPLRSTSDDTGNQSTDVPQLASQAGDDGKVASLPPRSSDPQPKSRQSSSNGKTSKTVKDLIKEQKGKDEGAELDEEEEEEDYRMKRFSKYDYFIQSLESGQAIDYSAHRISKYDSYIRKLKAGVAIHKVIGRRQSASQKIRDIISTQIHCKQNLDQNDLSVATEESHTEVTPEQYSAMMDNHIASNYTSKYDMYLNKLHNNNDSNNPFEMSGHDMASSESDTSNTSLNGITPAQLPLSNGNASLFDYCNHGGLHSNNHADLVIAEDDHELLFGEGTSKGSISNGTAKMVKDEITPGEMNIFSKYITRYSESAHCGHLHCVYTFKEHYHCTDEGCNFGRFTRKEDVVRHYNWHKRRDNSLQHGFMRFSPSDNCSSYYPECTINLKHTHYHCLQSGCNKVYTSTSDVLTHENFHKKNLSLISEGFQRFRATEDCGVPNCAFYGHKTTHFHCRRPGCQFIFKNKCDIEKHKTYHLKDDIYRKDGFKKYSKHEKCKYNWCKFSNNTNHFHCIRKNCWFVFTAANQMQSHKRKHDRRQRILEYEAARHQRGFSLRLIRPKPIIGQSTARRVRDAPETVLIQADGSVLPNRVKPLDYLPPTASCSQTAVTPITTTAETTDIPPPPPYSSISTLVDDGLNDSLNLPVVSHISPPQIVVKQEPMTAAAVSIAPPAAAAAASVAIATAACQSSLTPNWSSLSPSLSPSSSSSSAAKFSSSGIKTEGKPEEPWQKYLMRFTANDPCRPRCELLYKDHYHCKIEDCSAVYKSKEGVNKHARYHMLSDEASDLGFQYFQQGESCEELFRGCSFSPLAHYHCMWSLKPGIYCGEVVHTGSSLMKPHYDKHKQNPELESIHISTLTFAEAQAQSLSKTYTTHPLMPSPTKTEPEQPQQQETVASDLLPSTSSPGVAPGEGYISCEPDVCTVEDCPHRIKRHYHCTRGDCQFATESQDMLRDHKVNESVIFQSFRQMSRKLDCRRSGCKYNLLNKHYHCLHQGCNFSFLQIQQMESHGRKHMRRIYGKHFNKPGGSLIGPQQLVIPMVSASSVPFTTAVSNQIMFTNAAAPMLNQAVMPQVPANSTIVNTNSLGLMSVGGSLGVVNQVGIPVQVINPTTASTSTPLPPFMIPLAPLDEEESTGNYPPCTSRTTNDSATAAAAAAAATLPHYQAVTMKNMPAAVYPSMQIPRKRSLNLVEEDPGAPSGYKRYKRGPLDSVMNDRFRRYDRSENCCQESCQFNLTTTHYHCLHEDCTYRFAGKTMMYKHAQHHDRVNSIIQNDFRRFKASSECNQGGCPYRGNSTHFHCLRCSFSCTDSGKVTVHRKQHAKTDTISAAGFRQYSSSEPCGFVGCKYTLRYSHFHCNRDGCIQGVIGMTQMENHRRRHLLNVRV